MMDNVLMVMKLQKTTLGEGTLRNHSWVTNLCDIGGVGSIFTNEERLAVKQLWVEEARYFFLAY